MGDVWIQTGAMVTFLNSIFQLTRFCTSHQSPKAWSHPRASNARCSSTDSGVGERKHPPDKEACIPATRYESLPLGDPCVSCGRGFQRRVDHGSDRWLESLATPGLINTGNTCR
jgi:hypothetical protein